MKTNKTETTTINGVEYTVTNLAASFSVSSILVNDTIMVNANVRLQPFVVIDGKVTSTDLQDRAVLMADIFNSNDTDAVECANAINTAIEKYVLSKNI